MRAGNVKKYAIDLNPKALIKVGSHILIKLENGQKTIKFIRGKGNIIQTNENLTVMFSDLEKPVKLLKEGKHFIKGPKPSELIKEFNLQVYEKECVDDQFIRHRQKTIPFTLRIEKCVNELQKIIVALPEQIDVSDLQKTIFILNKLKDHYSSFSLPDQHRNIKSTFQESVREAHTIKRR